VLVGSGSSTNLLQKQLKRGAIVIDILVPTVMDPTVPLVCSPEVNPEALRRPCEI